MADHSNIESLGLLYEGSDYSQWESRIQMRFRHHGYSDLLLAPPYVRSRRKRYFNGYFSSSQVFQANVQIRGQVSSSLLQRIPAFPSQPQVQDLWTTITLLKGLARPFRFLDLPAEIRNQVYEMALATKSDVCIVADPRHSVSKRTVSDQLPALLRTSSQLRRESLPLFYAQTRFYVYFPNTLGDRTYLQQVIAKCCTWIRDVAKENVKYLQYVSLLSSSGTDLSLDFSKDAGLSLSFDYQHDYSSLVLRAKKKMYIEGIHKACKLAGIQNQSIVIALTSASTLWEHDGMSR